MHPFHDYLAEHLDALLRKHTVVVFYDPRQEFRPFFDRELEPQDSAPLPRVMIGTRAAFLARYAGSFFGLRAAVEPIVAADPPEPVILYLPGVARDRAGSVLMELERAGTCYEPQLKRLALNVLRQRYTDGQIDEMLRPAAVTYDDIVAYLESGGGATPSALHALFGGAQGEVLLTQWLASDARDEVLVEKEALPELLKLIQVRLGLELPEGTAIAAAREKTCRYVLINEFRADLSCEPPTSIGRVPSPPGKETLERLRNVAENLRRHHPAEYLGLADAVEQTFGLAGAGVSAAHLGSIDIFRFEERQLLAHVGALCSGKRYSAALDIVMARSRSFWVDRELRRQAQWEASRLMAELGLELERVRVALAGMGNDPARWFSAYTAEDGWHVADGRQRRLEAWVARMDEEPEAEQALAIIRHEYEHQLRAMADGFAKALAASVGTRGTAPDPRLPGHRAGDGRSGRLCPGRRHALRNGGRAGTPDRRGKGSEDSGGRRGFAIDYPCGYGGAAAGGVGQFRPGGGQGQTGGAHRRYGHARLERADQVPQGQGSGHGGDDPG